MRFVWTFLIVLAAGAISAQETIKGADMELLRWVREVAEKLGEARGEPFSRPPIALRAPQPLQQAAAEIHAFNVVSRERLSARGRAWREIGLGSDDSPRKLLVLLATDVHGVALDRQGGRLLIDPALLTGADFEAGSASEESTTLLLVTGVRADEPLLAHALMHLQQMYRDRGGPLAQTTDAVLARSAIAEGEANLVALRFLFDGMELADEVLQSPLTPGDYLDGALIPRIAEVLSPAELSLLRFVYDDGFAQVAALYRGGGWSSVDAALRVTGSTRDVLHPDLAGSTLSEFPSPAAPSDGLGLADEDTIGEQAIFTLLSLSTGKDNLALLAADGWNGDRLYRWEGSDPGQAVTEWKTRWRSVEDARDFGYAMRRSLNARFPDGSPVESADGGFLVGNSDRKYRLVVTNREVRLIVGPPSTAEAARIPDPERPGEGNHEPVR